MTGKRSAAPRRATPLVFGWSAPGPNPAAWLGDLDASGLAAVVATVALAVIDGWLGLRLMRCSFGGDFRTSKIAGKTCAASWAVSG